MVSILAICNQRFFALVLAMPLRDHLADNDTSIPFFFWVGWDVGCLMQGCSVHLFLLLWVSSIIYGSLFPFMTLEYSHTLSLSLYYVHRSIFFFLHKQSSISAFSLLVSSILPFLLFSFLSSHSFIKPHLYLFLTLIHHSLILVISLYHSFPWSCSFFLPQTLVSNPSTLSLFSSIIHIYSSHLSQISIMFFRILSFFFSFALFISLLKFYKIPWWKNKKSHLLGP